MRKLRKFAASNACGAHVGSETPSRSRPLRRSPARSTANLRKAAHFALDPRGDARRQREDNNGRGRPKLSMSAYSAASSRCWFCLAATLARARSSPRRLLSARTTARRLGEQRELVEVLLDHRRQRGDP